MLYSIQRYCTMAIETIDIKIAGKEVAKWVELVQQGVEVMLVDDDKPLARILPVGAPSKRVPGLNRGEIRASADFDEPLPESFWLEE
jgi:antitoxin (DNA-binding transcriptional repressor) of toxin-antitoxin stability system